MKHVIMNNGIVYYDLYGKGAPIIFIHPPGLGRIVFRNQKPLSKQFKLIFPDLSGHGGSSSIFHGSLIDEYVQEIKAVLDTEQIETAIILGYSAGGMVAQEFALTYPSRTKAVILSGGYPSVETAGLHLMYRLGMYVLRQSPDLLAKILATSHAKDKLFRKELYLHMKKANVDQWYQFYHETFHYNSIDRLSQITVPICCVYGEKATWINKHHVFFDKCPNNEIAFIENGFHQIPTKKAAELNQIVKKFIGSKLARQRSHF